MPIYEYECEQCGERMERLQRLGEPPLVDCPACGAPRLRRLLSAPAFQFKGSGWYVTDYARKGGEAGKAKEGGEAASAGGEKPATAETTAAKQTPKAGKDKGEQSR